MEEVLTTDGVRREKDGPAETGNDCLPTSLPILFCSNQLSCWFKPGNNDYLIWPELNCGEEKDTKTCCNDSRAGLLRLVLRGLSPFESHPAKQKLSMESKTSNLSKDIRLKQLNQSESIRKGSWFSSNPNQLVTYSWGRKHPLNSSAAHAERQS